ncbi:MAG: hypothetical protein GXC73_12980 [Chitinophagaceae bacterium]|nr:hypothetical protein [Chitinophagaceae bacterium]
MNPDKSKNIDHYNVDGYPTFYLIDMRGNIIKGFKGYYKPLGNELNNLIKENL